MNSPREQIEVGKGLKVTGSSQWRTEAPIGGLAKASGSLETRRGKKGLVALQSCREARQWPPDGRTATEHGVNSGGEASLACKIQIQRWAVARASWCLQMQKEDLGRSTRAYRVPKSRRLQEILRNWDSVGNRICFMAYSSII